MTEYEPICGVTPALRLALPAAFRPHWIQSTCPSLVRFTVPGGVALLALNIATGVGVAVGCACVGATVGVTAKCCMLGGVAEPVCSFPGCVFTIMLMTPLLGSGVEDGCAFSNESMPAVASTMIQATHASPTTSLFLGWRKLDGSTLKPLGFAMGIVKLEYGGSTGVSLTASGGISDSTKAD